MARKQVKQNFVDKAVSFLSPSRGVKRLAARHALSLMAEPIIRGIDAIGSGRLRGSDWVSGNSSADADMYSQRASLRAAIRRLMVNNPYAIGAKRRIVANTIGTGITLQSRVKADEAGSMPLDNRNGKPLSPIDERLADSFNKQAERVWRYWSESKEADAGGRLNFTGQQKLCLGTWVVDGECFHRFTHKKDSSRYLPLCIETIDPDRVGTWAGMSSNPHVRDGIELGEGSEPVAYHVAKNHPSDIVALTNADYDRVAAKLKNGLPGMAHVYEMNRPGETRGYSPLAPSLAALMDLHYYWEAEIVAARMGACIGLVVESDPSFSPAQGYGDANADGDTEFEMKPGMMTTLPPGRKIVSINPNRPNTSMPQFTQMILRAIGVGLDLPYELIALDFSQTNYSSARAALLQAYIVFRMLQRFIAQNLCQPTFENVITEAAALGKIDIPNFSERRRDYLAGARWMYPGWERVDPAKEAKGIKEMLGLNLTSPQREIGKQGEDWEEIFTENGKAKEMLEKLGLWIEPKAPGERTATDDIKEMVEELINDAKTD